MMAEAVVLQPGTEGKDTYICDCSPDVNNPNGPTSHLYQGQFGSCYDRLLIEWDLSSLTEENITIESAIMELRFNVLHGQESGQMVHFPILEEWVETEVTYNTQPAISRDDSVVTVWPTPGQWHSVDLTRFVAAWLDDPTSNHGMYGHCFGTNSTCCAEFQSSDSSDEETRPKLTIVYSVETDADPSEGVVPTQIEAIRAYPNPFSSQLSIRYSTQRYGSVSLSILDLLGREVASLTSATLPAGEHVVNWRPVDEPSGVYLVVVKDSNGTGVNRVMLER
jgi:hypothetical protein